MTVIEVDASCWRSVPDFHASILKALGAPDWHGMGIDALIDSMIYGGINDVKPPYRLEIGRLREAGREARDELYLAIGSLAEHGAFGRLLGGDSAHIEVLGSPYD